jgi:hypothetical protein
MQDVVQKMKAVQADVLTYLKNELPSRTAR